ncbi:major facilitator superfamily domain-containing protein [Suillus variegatus]|nr:major facilitator superfamily domain-containing protein [Suillus variegatus]
MSSLRNDSIESNSEKQIVLNPSPRERARILRKIDWHLLPFVTVFYLFSYLDRANIGYAKVGGMATNLHLTGFRYNIAAAVYYIPHSFAEVPSNIALKLLRPSRWIPSIMVAWGIVSTLMCLIRSYQSLVVARVFLGLTEAGLFPGVNYYICLWYPRSERSKRIAIFFSSASVAGAFSGLLATDGRSRRTTWLAMDCYSSLVLPFSLFTPTIINELGYSAAHAQLLSVPPFVAGCIATIIVGIYSDKHNLRAYERARRIVGACLAATGYYPTIPIIMAWTGSNAGGHLKRGVVLAMIGLSNLGGICSSFIYIDPPRFHIGHGTVMGFLSLAIITSLFAMWDYNRLNKKKEAQCLAENISDDRGYEFEDMGDASPLFRYTI